MKVQVELSLTRRANGSGGDRYEGKINNEDKKPWVIYIPQSISREGSITRQELTVTVE